MGEIAGGILGLVGTGISNQANAASVQQQEQFQANQSSTAYQRQVTDMKMAGLNPMFAVNSGGASTPSGSTYQSQNPLAPVQAGVNQAITDSMQKQRVDNETKQTAADLINKAAQADNTAAQTAATKAQTTKTGIESQTSQYQQNEERVRARMWDAADKTLSNANLKNWLGRTTTGAGDLMYKMKSMWDSRPDNTYDSNHLNFKQSLP